MPVNVIDTIEPKNNGQFPVVRDVDVEGGIQVQPTIVARDAIPIANQKVGMLVYVTANSTYYQLTATGSPGTWTTANLGNNTNLAGDVTGTNAANSVVNIHGASVPASGSLTTGNTLQVTGANALSYSPINLAGGVNYITGVLPLGNQANQTMGGDVSGTTNASSVIKIRGTTVSTNSVANDGYALVSTGGTYVPTGIAPVLNVRNFGAVGDGIADDSNAIQAAFNVLSGFGTYLSGTIYFPTGTYKITKTLTFISNYFKGIRFLGDFCGQDNSGSVIKWDGPAGGTMMITYALNTSRFENLNFDANYIGLCCVQLVPYRVGGLTDSFNNSFEHCIFQRATGTNSALVMLNDGTATDAVAGIQFRYCGFFGDGNTIGGTFACVMPRQSAQGNTEQFLFQSCEFSNAQYGFYFFFATNEMTFIDCQFGSMYVACVLAHGSGHLYMLECGAENNNTVAPYIGKGQFFQAFQAVRVHVDSCEILMNVTNEPLHAICQGYNDAITIENSVVDGSAENGSQTCASVTIGGLPTTALTIRGCEWINLPVPVVATTHIPVNDGGNQLTDLGGVASTRLPIILEQNFLQDTAEVTHNELPYRGTPSSSWGAVGMNTPGPNSTIIYRAEPRQTTTCYEINFNNVKTAATSNQILLEALASKIKIVAVVADVTSAFTGGSISGITVSVGSNGGSVGGAEFLIAQTCQTTATYGLASGDLGVSLSSPVQGGKYLWGGLGGGSISVTFASTGANLSDLTAGVVRVYLTVEYLDFQVYS